jgi:phosphotransferase system  glucose/maltose/N-acetylglucosamine-specific IIC component
VEDAGSLLAGYVAFCAVLVTVFLLSAFPLWLMRRSRYYDTARSVVIATAIILAVVAFVLVMFGVHDIWNNYQAWYATPLDPSWQPVTPENWRPLLSG